MQFPTMHSQTDLQRLLQIATQAAEQAKKAILACSETKQITSEAGRDIKMAADLRAHEALLQFLSRETDFEILSEEDPRETLLNSSKPLWVVDPLDGTFNFSRGFPYFGVSVALVQENRPLVGVIDHVPEGSVYTAIPGVGAWRNGQKLAVSKTAKLSSAALFTGFPVNFDLSSENLGKFSQFVSQFKKVRMIGSAALSLATVSSGTGDCYYEENINLWDVAAGLALVQGAGGRTDVRAGSKPFALTVLATNGSLPLQL